MECIRGQVRWSGMHARTLVSECYSQLASISHEAHHSRARECQGEGNHQRAFRSFPQHKLREKCMQAEVCYHMRRGGRKSTKPKSSTSSRFGARSPSAQRVLEAVRSRFERPFAALDRRSRSWRAPPRDSTNHIGRRKPALRSASTSKREAESATGEYRVQMRNTACG